MAGKADKLKIGAKKTGHGLFYGMEKLNTQETGGKSKDIITSDTDKSGELTEKINDVDDVEITDRVAVTEDTGIDEAIDIKTEPKEEPTVHTDDDSLSRRPVDQIPDDKAHADTDGSEMIEEIMMEVARDKQAEGGPVLNEPAKTLTPVATVDDEMVSKSIKSSDADDEQIINVTINKQKQADEKAEKKKNSRYEKDKFLLLDIRGYRDYIEHIAKAANMSATKYIRSLIEQDMEKNKDIYLAHKRLEEMLRGKDNLSK